MSYKLLGEKVNELKELANLSFASLQSFDGLTRQFTLGVPVMLGDSLVKLIHKEDGHLRFYTEIKPGTKKSFELHWHDCLEVCTVIEGAMGDLALPEKKAVKGQQLFYKPYMQHQPYNPGKQTLKIHVDFYRTD